MVDSFTKSLWDSIKPGDYFLDYAQHMKELIWHPRNQSANPYMVQASAGMMEPSAPFTKDLYRAMFQCQGDKLSKKETKSDYQWLGTTANYGLEILKFLAPRDRVIFSGLAKDVQDDNRFTHEILFDGTNGYTTGGAANSFTDSHHAWTGSAPTLFPGQGTGKNYNNLNMLGGVANWNQVYTHSTLWDGRVVQDRQAYTKDETTWDPAKMLFGGSDERDADLESVTTSTAVGKIHQLTVGEIDGPMVVNVPSGKPSSPQKYYKVILSANDPSKRFWIVEADPDRSGTLNNSVVVNGVTLHYDTGKYEGTPGSMDPPLYDNNAIIDTDAITGQCTTIGSTLWARANDVLKTYTPVENGGSYNPGALANTYAYTGSWRDIAVNTNYAAKTGIWYDRSGGGNGYSKAENAIALMVGLNESRRRYFIALTRLLGDNGSNSGSAVDWWKSEGKSLDWYNMMLLDLVVGNQHGFNNNMSGIFNENVSAWSLAGAWSDRGVGLRKAILEAVSLNGDISQGIDKTKVDQVINDWGGGAQLKAQVYNMISEYAKGQSSFPKNTLNAGYSYPNRTDWENYVGTDDKVGGNWYHVENQFIAMNNSATYAGLGPYDFAEKLKSAEDAGTPLTTNWFVHDVHRIKAAYLESLVVSFGETIINNGFSRRYKNKWTDYTNEKTKKAEELMLNEQYQNKIENERRQLNQKSLQEAEKKAQEFRSEMLALMKKRNEEKKKGG